MMPLLSDTKICIFRCLKLIMELNSTLEVIGNNIKLIKSNWKVFLAIFSFGYFTSFGISYIKNVSEINTLKSQVLELKNEDSKEIQIELYEILRKLKFNIREDKKPQVIDQFNDVYLIKLINMQNYMKNNMPDYEYYDLQNRKYEFDEIRVIIKNFDKAYSSYKWLNVL